MMKSGRMGWAGHIERIREKRKVYRLLVGKPEGKTTKKTKREVGE
jgi:hypothetical protein